MTKKIIFTKSNFCFIQGLFDKQAFIFTNAYRIFASGKSLSESFQSWHFLEFCYCDQSKAKISADGKIHPTSRALSIWDLIFPVSMRIRGSQAWSNKRICKSLDSTYELFLNRLLFDFKSIHSTETPLRLRQTLVLRNTRLTTWYCIECMNKAFYLLQGDTLYFSNFLVIFFRRD